MDTGAEKPESDRDRSSKFDEGDPKPKEHDGKKGRGDERNRNGIRSRKRTRVSCLTRSMRSVECGKHALCYDRVVSHGNGGKWLVKGIQTPEEPVSTPPNRLKKGRSSCWSWRDLMTVDAERDVSWRKGSNILRLQTSHLHLHFRTAVLESRHRLQTLMPPQP